MVQAAVARDPARSTLSRRVLMADRRPAMMWCMYCGAEIAGRGSGKHVTGRAHLAAKAAYIRGLSSALAITSSSVSAVVKAHEDRPALSALRQIEVVDHG